MADHQRPKNKFVAFFDKTAVKTIYAFLAFILAFIMFLMATDTGSILDWAIFFLLLYMGILDTVTVVRRLRVKRDTQKDQVENKRGE